MKLLLPLLASLFLASPVFAEPPVPTAKQMAEWAAFSKPVSLKATKIKGGDFLKKGDPVWVYEYASGTETLTTFVIGLYKAGTLFGNDRAKMEKLSVDTAAQFKQLSQKDTSKDGAEIAKVFQVQTRPDGRKVYFTLAGFGIGGSAIMGFTKLGQYDLLVERIDDSGEDFPAGKIPPTPTKDLPGVLSDLENYLAGKTKQ